MVRIPGIEKPYLERVGKRELRLGDEAGSPPGIKDMGEPRGCSEEAGLVISYRKQTP